MARPGRAGAAENDAMVTPGRFSAFRPLAPRRGAKVGFSGRLDLLHAHFRRIDVYLLPPLDDVCLEVYLP